MKRVYCIMQAKGKLYPYVKVDSRNVNYEWVLISLDCAPPGTIEYPDAPMDKEKEDALMKMCDKNEEQFVKYFEDTRIIKEFQYHEYEGATYNDKNFV